MAKYEKKTISKVSAATADPGLAALFASSAGPVTVPARPARSKAATTSTSVAVNEQSKSEEESPSVVSSVASTSASESSEDEIEVAANRPRKRRKVDSHEDLESRYLNKLAHEEEQEQKAIDQQRNSKKDENVNEESDGDSDLNSELEDLSDEDDDPEVFEKSNDTPKHESLTETAHSIEAEKTKRTAFLGNVSISCMTSKSAKKALVQHIQSAIDTKHHEKIESIRFRSTAFAADAGPKRAAFAKKEIMEQTMKSTNAYVVLNVEAAARKVAAKLNGTVLLDRHLKADHLGNPLKTDHKRCVFVGNLSFVDEAADPNEEAGQKRKRAKEPADVDEGLWRCFGKVGRVESVRVIRDKETRISKGFAYVQFVDENAVEAALLLDGKKFPPMLPRLLRVSRAKRELKKDKRSKEISQYGQRKQGNDRSKSKQSRPPHSTGAPGQKMIFEGNRAISSSMPRGLKRIKKRPSVKPTNRSSKRAAAFRAGGSKKKREAAA